MLRSLFTTVAVGALTASVSMAQESRMIPRDVLFANPERANVRLSPDGETISFLSDVEGVLNLWVAPSDDPSMARPVTRDTGRGIRNYGWAYTSRHIVYLQDKDGDENNHVYVLDLVSGKVVDRTPIEEILGPDGQPLRWPDGRVMRPQATLQGGSELYPTEMLIGLNDRNPQFHDLHRLNIVTGEMSLVEQNDRFAGFVTDNEMRVRFAMQQTPDGGTEYLKRTASGGWDTFMRIGMEDALTTALSGFDKSNERVYALDSRGRDTAALVAMDIQTGQSSILGVSEKADVSGALTNPITYEIEGFSVNHERVEWEIFDDEVRQDIDFLKTVNDGDISIISRTLDDTRWVVHFRRDNGPSLYYLFDREKTRAVFLFNGNTKLDSYELAPMHPVTISARDGLGLVSYLTLPTWTDADGDARPSEALPMVLLVHGGPWARDSWGFNPMHQWLANRGYAVLSVNFRGSTGFGKGFLNAGNLEWARKMHDDLLDATDWAVAQGIADPDRVAIMGGSYGGYATLVGLTMTPDTFACGVDIVGPSNLVTLLETIPPYWKPLMELFAKRVGDPRTDEGKALLEERSPLNFVDNITRPLLIGQGANDPRVKQSEADQIVEIMEEKQIPVTYVLYEDEGHGFARPQNRMSFNAVTEAFLAEHLGGRYQPIDGDFEGSSIEVPSGADEIRGVRGALRAKK